MLSIVGWDSYPLQARGEGVEPSYWASKAHVLPLDDPRMLKTYF